jgi:alpha-galactosidase
MPNGNNSNSAQYTSSRSSKRNGTEGTPMKALPLSVAFSCLIPLASLLAQDPPYYHKQSTWQETMRLSREARIAGMQQPSLTVGPWSVAGPFTASGGDAFHEVFPPEQENALDSMHEAGALRWMPRPEWSDGTIVPFAALDRSAMYLQRTIEAPQDTAITAYFGSDDGIHVWINGALALENNASRSCAPDQEATILHLHKGANLLLLKISNGIGETGFYYSLIPAEPSGTWRRLERDFPDSVSMLQMTWERQDSIWDKDWTPGDWAELGERYQRGVQRSYESQMDDTVPPVVTVTDERSLLHARELYLAARRKEYVILTPSPSPVPRINSAHVFGVRPGHPVLFTIAATGERPIRFFAKGLPKELTLDENTGRLSGSIKRPGNYPISFRAKNARGSASQYFLLVVGETLALTPPMGWNSWYVLENRVTDRDMRAAADAMVKTGMINHGYSYVNIDDCWAVKPGSSDPALGGEPRDVQGRIRSNGRFPDMKALTAYIHGKGLKAGIYSSPGPLTCAGHAGCYQHEQLDARQFADWGFDFLKYDWCSYGSIARDHSLPELKRPYALIAPILRSLDRDMLLNLCQYGMGHVSEWGGEFGQCWRTTGDLGASFENIYQSMSAIGFGQNGLERWAGPGRWNDPDYLLLGYISNWRGGTSLTPLSPNEQYMYVSLWCLLASPLFFSGDMTRLDPFTLSLLTNDEVLDIDQDPLGKQGFRVVKKGDLEVWKKELQDGSVAAGLFNRGEKRDTIGVRWEDLHIKGRFRVRDLWRQKDLGIFDGLFHARVPRHGVMLVRLYPVR